MKNIGFIDYYLSEWHADNYPVWIKELNEKNGTNFVVKYAFGEKDSEVDGKTSEEWCAAFGVNNCSTIEEVCEKSDYIIILSPSNPEKHLEYAEKVLAYKKRTYIDKTFAPDFKTAKAIFDIAKKYDTSFFSSSALRYATELDEIKGCDSIVTTGGGRSIEEYCIHQIEMIVKSIASKPNKMKLEKCGNGQYTVSICFEDGKSATMIYADAFPFSACANVASNSVYKTIESDFFKYLLTDIMNFFESGNISFDTSQTLDAMKIRDGIILGTQNDGKWISLSDNGANV